MTDRDAFESSLLRRGSTALELRRAGAFYVDARTQVAFDAWQDALAVERAKQTICSQCGQPFTNPAPWHAAVPPGHAKAVNEVTDLSEPVRFEPDVLLACAQARQLQDRIDSLQCEQDALLQPVCEAALARMTETGDGNPLRALANALPRGFYRSELFTALNSLGRQS